MGYKCCCIDLNVVDSNPFVLLRSRATSPSASAPSDSAAAAGDEGYARLTARQRARMEKEAGLAEDVAWHEMELLPNLTYTWKGKGANSSWPQEKHAPSFSTMLTCRRALHTQHTTSTPGILLTHPSISKVPRLALTSINTTYADK